MLFITMITYLDKSAGNKSVQIIYVGQYIASYHIRVNYIWYGFYIDDCIGEGNEYNKLMRTRYPWDCRCNEFYL